jgi:hypothetical protein
MSKRKKKIKRSGESLRRGNLKGALGHYYSLFEKNQRDGFSCAIYPREYEPIPKRVDLNSLNWEYVRNCISEEEGFRKRVHERNREIERAERKRAREKEEDEIASASLSEAIRLFEREAFEREMVWLGVEPTYIEFDMEWNAYESNSFGFRRRMKRMRENLNGRLKDFSAEVMKD